MGVMHMIMSDERQERGPDGEAVGRTGEAPAEPLAPVGTRRVRREALGTQALDRLREMIIEGELAPGARVVETALCAALDVSRTPLREALKLLAAEGLVELLPHRGARIARFTAAEARELFEVIAGLESLAAEFAAARMSERQLGSLEELHARMARHHARRRRHDYFDLNSRIHEIIVDFSGNSVLRETHARLMARAGRGRYMAILSPERWDEAMGEHEAIMRAFRERDPAVAASVWRQHLRRTGEVVQQALDAEPRGPAMTRRRA